MFLNFLRFGNQKKRPGKFLPFIPQQHILKSMSQDLKQLINADLNVKPSRSTSVGKSPEEMWLDKATKVATIIVDCLENGLTEADGCTLAGITLQDYETLKSKAPGLSKLIEQTKIHYKLALMKPITNAIKAGDVNKAQWYMERKFPKEFGASAKRMVNGDNDDDQNPIGDIISRIQNGEHKKSSINPEILDL